MADVAPSRYVEAATVSSTNSSNTYDEIPGLTNAMVAKINRRTKPATDPEGNLLYCRIAHVDCLSGATAPGGKSQDGGTVLLTLRFIRIEFAELADAFFLFLLG